MTTQTFGRILHSEQVQLRTLNHATRSVFQELKCKYYPPNKNNPNGSPPDFLNAQELKAAGISKPTYQSAIRELLKVGLIRDAGRKTINGRKCRLFDYPHELGIIKERQMVCPSTEGKIVLPQEENGFTRHGKPFASLTVEGQMALPQEANGFTRHGKNFDYLLDTEEKKIKKEDTEDTEEVDGEKSDSKTGVNNIQADMPYGSQPSGVDEEIENPLHNIKTFLEDDIKNVEATIKTSASKISTQHSDDKPTMKKQFHPWTEDMRSAFNEVSVLYQKLHSEGFRDVKEATPLLTQLKVALSRLKPFPGLHANMKIINTGIIQWIKDHPTQVDSPIKNPPTYDALAAEQNLTVAAVPKVYDDAEFDQWDREFTERLNRFKKINPHQFKGEAA